MLHRSRREQYRNNQLDPLVIWLGRPSKALAVSGKRGEVPVLTSWISYANVMYVQCPASNTDNIADNFAGAFTLWTEKNDWALSRDLYLGGNEFDETGGRDLLVVALKLLSNEHAYSATPILKGVMVGFPHYTPSAMFFAHRSFETGNGLTHWTANRARQKIVCNSYFSQVMLVGAQSIITVL